MRRYVPLLIAFSFAFLFAGAAVYWGIQAESAEAEEPSGPTDRLLLQVERLSCGSCEAKIRRALASFPGVTAVAVDVDGRTVTVEYAQGSADPKALADAVTRAGFPAHYVASGPAVAPVPSAGSKPGRGCGGGCCS